MERDFADRTTRVIIEKAAPFYAVRNSASMLACCCESVSIFELGRGMSAKSLVISDRFGAQSGHHIVIRE